MSILFIVFNIKNKYIIKYKYLRQFGGAGRAVKAFPIGRI